MTSQQRIEIMRVRLTEAFSPSRLDIIDDSHQHVGHAGAAGGAGHYTIIIEAATLREKSRVEIHREIYQTLADLIPAEIHALQIKALSSK